MEKTYNIENFTYSESGFLGEGSFGKVYKGKNKKNNELVAIKSSTKLKSLTHILLKVLKKKYLS